MALGCWLFCSQRPVMPTANKHYKTRGFVAFVVVFIVARCCPNSNNITTKELTTTTNNNNSNNLNNRNKNKQQLNNNHGTPNSSKQKNKDTQKTATTPNPMNKYTIKQLVLLLLGFVLFLVVVAQPT